MHRGPRRKPLPAGSVQGRVSKTCQLWVVAHRTKPWAEAHTTTNAPDTPGYHLPGCPAVYVTHDHLGECPETLHTTKHICPACVRTIVCMFGRLPCISQVSGLQLVATTKRHPYHMQCENRYPPFSPLFLVHVRGAPRPLGASTPAMRPTSLLRLEWSMQGCGPVTRQVTP